MENETIFDRVSELTEKFKAFFIQKKKLAALTNYSQVIPFTYTPYLNLIKRCMADGFLDEKEADFLNHMINKHFSETNFLDWSHRTKWLKEEMRRRGAECNKHTMVQPYFDWDKMADANAAKVPVELLAQQQAPRASRRA